MTEPRGADTPEYLAEHVRHALTTDARTTVQGLRVRVTESEVFVAGHVGSEERRSAVTEVAAEVLPDRRIHNDVAIVELDGQHRTERIR
jgi:osmotically-inducible protein OsmY